MFHVEENAFSRSRSFIFCASSRLYNQQKQHEQGDSSAAILCSNKSIIRGKTLDYKQQQESSEWKNLNLWWKKSVIL